ncbi:Uncharacterised protein [Leclercia adecarboxylata]|uniref:Uncharacterized protein n=1 Tax=Leclercia adecarboxylata TaxID=83655 RepID=A0A4U9I2H3_9ENTR|nr:Uncharacterised protein [Leclercia adecarboxylata]
MRQQFGQFPGIGIRINISSIGFQRHAYPLTARGLQIVQRQPGLFPLAFNVA